MDTKALDIPDEVRQEIDAFAAEVERLNRGEVGDDDFKRFRLQQGIYGQRQDGEQMVRTKLPAGIMTSDQLRGLADFAVRGSLRPPTSGFPHRDSQFSYREISL